MCRPLVNKIILCFSFQFIVLNICAQNAQKTDLTSWTGTWKGSLNINNADGKTLRVPMTLDIKATDSTNRYSWTIIYGEGKNMQIRPYELLDKGNGQLAIDEKNSIVLDAFLLGNTLVTRFEVKGSMLMITYQLLESQNQIIFRVYSGKHKPLNTTGGDKKVPVVKTYPLGVMQEAYLKKNT